MNLINLHRIFLFSIIFCQYKNYGQSFEKLPNLDENYQLVNNTTFDNKGILKLSGLLDLNERQEKTKPTTYKRIRSVIKNKSGKMKNDLLIHHFVPKGLNKQAKTKCNPTCNCSTYPCWCTPCTLKNQQHQFKSKRNFKETLERKSINRLKECCDVCKMKCETSKLIPCDCHDCVHCKKVSVCQYSYCYYNLPEGEEFPKSTICETLISNFPTALHNKKICEERKENANEWTDWLRNNLDLCDQSKDYHKRFTENNCKDLYCKGAKLEHEKWKTEYENMCNATNKYEDSCQILKNNIEAFNQMNC